MILIVVIGIDSGQVENIGRKFKKKFFYLFRTDNNLLGQYRSVLEIDNRNL